MREIYILKKQLGNRTGQKKSGVPCFYSQMKLSSWNSLRTLYEQNTNRWNGWLFRGQIIPKGTRKSRCPLETSLERGMSRFNIPLSKARIWEYRLLRDFKRRYHLVNDQPLDQKNSMEWLALLRHYGGPARLMDWTYSFWVAVHFAVDRAKAGDTCEIWALEAPWWREQAEKEYQELTKVVKIHGSNSVKESEQVFCMKKSPGLWFLSPFRLNDRLAAQQGAFVLPLDVTRTLEDNLTALTPNHKSNKHIKRYWFTVTPSRLKSCLRELQRLNITRMTLYPGIEGLAQHYENALCLPHLFKGIDGDLCSGPQ